MGVWELSFFENSARLILDNGKKRIVLRPTAGKRIMTSLHLLHSLNQNPGLSFYALAKLSRMDTANCRKLVMELGGLGLLRIKMKGGEGRRAAQVFSNAAEIRVLLNEKVALAPGRLKALGKHRGG